VTPGAPSSSPPHAVETLGELLRPLILCLRRRSGIVVRRAATQSKSSLEAAPGWGTAEDVEWRLRLGKEAEDLQRLHAALLLLLRSLDSADAVSNFCSLAVAGSLPLHSQPRLQRPRAMWRPNNGTHGVCRARASCLWPAPSSLVRLQSSGSGSPAQLHLCLLVVRASIVITDAAAWKFLPKDTATPGTPGASQAAFAAVEAYSLLPALLQRQPVTFCQALRTFILGHCPVTRDSGGTEGTSGPKEGLNRDILTDPTDQYPAGSAPSPGQGAAGRERTDFWSFRPQKGGGRGARRKPLHLASADVAHPPGPPAHFYPQDCPAASPRIHAPAATSGGGRGEGGSCSSRVQLPPAAWALANLSMLCCASQPSSAAGGGSRALDSLPLEVFVGTAIGLAQQAVARVEQMQREAQAARRRAKGRRESGEVGGGGGGGRGGRE